MKASEERSKEELGAVAESATGPIVQLFCAKKDAVGPPYRITKVFRVLVHDPVSKTPDVALIVASCQRDLLPAWKLVAYVTGGALEIQPASRNEDS